MKDARITLNFNGIYSLKEKYQVFSIKKKQTTLEKECNIETGAEY